MKTALTQLVPSIDSVTDLSPVGGGCISDAARVGVSMKDGQTKTLFVKSNAASFAENFRCEAGGLGRLRTAGAIRVPEVVAQGVVDGRAWLVLEWIDTARRGGGFFADFGRRLAELHRATLGDRIGLDHDNFLGSARQINSPETSWVRFVAEHRIGFQLRWAIDRGIAGDRLRRDVQRVIDRLDDLLSGRDESTSLVHGDLWSGNYLCDSGGQPVIIDPAVYHGCREAELGMLRLFGGCPSEFGDAYQDSFPMPDGWQRRTSVYVLYHLLNHLNLFGSGYRDQCQSLAAELLS